MSISPASSQYKDSRNLRKRGNLHSRYGNRSWFDFVAGHLEMPARQDVLDVGCGGGWFWSSSINLLPAELCVTLGDKSKGMVEEAVHKVCAQDHYFKVAGQVLDAASLPFADQSFDAVIAMHMLYHVRDPALAIREMVRVLRPGGFVALSTNGDDNLRDLFALGANAFGGVRGDPAARIFSADNAQNLLSRHFASVDVYRYEDAYAINDGDDIFDYLTSFPPGVNANETQETKLRNSISDYFDQHDNMLETSHQVALVCGREPFVTQPISYRDADI